MRRNFCRAPEDARMAITKDACLATLLQSIETSRRFEQPYPHWFLQRLAERLADRELRPVLDVEILARRVVDLAPTRYAAEVRRWKG